MARWWWKCAWGAELSGRSWAWAEAKADFIFGGGWKWWLRPRGQCCWLAQSEETGLAVIAKYDARLDGCRPGGGLWKQICRHFHGMISIYEVWWDAGQQNWSCKTSAEKCAATHTILVSPRGGFGVANSSACRRRTQMSRERRRDIRNAISSWRRLRNHPHDLLSSQGIWCHDLLSMRAENSNQQGSGDRKIWNAVTQLRRLAQLRGPTPSKPFGFTRKDFDVRLIATSALKAEKSNNWATETAKAEMQAIGSKKMPQACEHLVSRRPNLSSLPRQRSYSCPRSCKRVESKFSQSESKW
jgi:hypothetical protein